MAGVVGGPQEASESLPEPVLWGYEHLMSKQGLDLGDMDVLRLEFEPERHAYHFSLQKIGRSKSTLITTLDRVIINLQHIREQVKRG